MPTIADLIGKGALAPSHRPWPRAVVAPAVWSLAAAGLAEGDWTLVSLWGHERTMHMALLDERAPDIGIVSVECRDGGYPSVGARHAPALRFERAIRDLHGLVPEDLPDRRAWLDHGRWGVRAPLGAVAPSAERADPYDFLPSEGESLHQIPVGPVHAGIIEPGHFRFTANGETVVRLEQRLGYVHKGIEGLMRGADLDRAARLAARVSGDSTVAYGWAFAAAVEAALGIEAPPRAQGLRALMAELERLANHFGDIGAICNDASFALMHAHCGVLRERVLRAAETAFGHRLMRDRIVPGGVAADLGTEGRSAVIDVLANIRRRFPALIELYDNTASLLDRTVGTGIVTSALARQYGAGGYVGRASGRAFDARRNPGYAPYDRLGFEVPTRAEGDVNARVWIRVREVEQSLSLVEQVLAGLEDGPVLATQPDRAGEGSSLVEGFRGDVFAWVGIGGARRVEHCHLRDPSWFQWPLLEAAIEGNIVADFPLCNKSFNCSYSGHDM